MRLQPHTKLLKLFPLFSCPKEMIPFNSQYSSCFYNYTFCNITPWYDQHVLLTVTSSYLLSQIRVLQQVSFLLAVRLSQPKRIKHKHSQLLIQFRRTRDTPLMFLQFYLQTRFPPIILAKDLTYPRHCQLHLDQNIPIHIQTLSCMIVVFVTL